MKNTSTDYIKINDAVMQNAPLDTLIALCRDIDIESCFDPVFEPSKNFLDVCKRYWENYYAEIMKSKHSVPTFYAQGEDGTLYFYHGNNRIRVSERFKPQGRTYGEIAAETIRYVAQEEKSGKIIAPAS
jgi:hypothetical protein